MKYISIKGQGSPITIRQALEAGLAPDGSLYVPILFPHFEISDFSSCSSLSDVGSILLEPFFEDDLELRNRLPSICANALNFEVPCLPIPDRAGDYLLELFHGPTCAFKDVGARFLAQCMANQSQPKTVIVATSGDTGGAVAAAFFESPGIDVVILYPKGKISSRQEKQLCAWGGNVRAFAVNGVFDDCQRIAKEALLTQDSTRTFLSANSINLGRVLPQMVYYAYSSLDIFKATGKKPGYIIPSGNLGNSLAALWARTLGLPMGAIHLALNANQGVAEFLTTGTLPNHNTISTLANAMDVAKPSNLERVRALYPTHAELRNHVTASSVSDQQIEDEIRTSEQIWGQALCPHTATAAVARRRIPDSSTPWVLVATAHPAKFESIVEPLIGHSVPIPESLKQILDKPSNRFEIEPHLQALLRALNSSTS